MAVKVGRRKERLPHGSAKERILDTAENLFADSGLEGVSFRDLASAAGVSLSATHYYFGSKEAVLAEVFARHAKMMTDRRTALLDRATASGRTPSLEEVLDAFLRPAFELTLGDRNDVLNRLLARLAVERDEVTRNIRSAAFDENDRTFIAALQLTLPELNAEVVHWRFHFLVGSMIYTMSGAGQLEGLSQDQYTTADTDKALALMISSFAALFNAA